MAAILCNAINDICKGTCDALGQIICLPCKACGFATRELSDFCRSPMCLYLTCALGLNLPPIVYAFKTGIGGGFAGDGSCKGAANWLYVNAALCFVNMAAAFYITHKLTQETFAAASSVNDGTYVEASIFSKEAKAHESVVSVDNTRTKSFARVKEILCYDPAVAVYILIGTFYLIWQAMGVGRSAGAVGCGGDLAGNISTSLMCGFLFICFGGVTFACSICCLR